MITQTFWENWFVKVESPMSKLKGLRTQLMLNTAAWQIVEVFIEVCSISTGLKTSLASFTNVPKVVFWSARDYCHERKNLLLPSSYALKSGFMLKNGKMLSFHAYLNCESCLHLIFHCTSEYLGELCIHFSLNIKVSYTTLIRWMSQLHRRVCSIHSISFFCKIHS